MSVTSLASTKKVFCTFKPKAFRASPDGPPGSSDDIRVGACFSKPRKECNPASAVRFWSLIWTRGQVRHRKSSGEALYGETQVPVFLILINGAPRRIRTLNLLIRRKQYNVLFFSQIKTITYNEKNTRMSFWYCLRTAGARPSPAVPERVAGRRLPPGPQPFVDCHGQRLRRSLFARRWRRATGFLEFTNLLWIRDSIASRRLGPIPFTSVSSLTRP